MDENQNSPQPEGETSPNTSPTPTKHSSSMEYAGFGRRFLATCVDTIILSIIGVGLLSVSSDVSQIISLVIYAGYSVLFWVNYHGATPGKKLMAIQVVKTDGSPVTYSTAIIRYFGYILSSIVFCLGYLWVIWDKKKQGWHDKVAQTIVVKTDQKPRTFLALLLIIIPLILLIAFVALVGVAGFALFNAAKDNPEAFKNQVEKNETLNKLVPTRTQNQADQLASTIFINVNKHRISQGLSEWQQDTKLCAYAQRRLEHLNNLGRYDDSKGFYEDTANKSIVNAYFSEYTNVGNTWHEVSGLTTAETVVVDWKENKGSNPTIINDKTYSHACVRADNKFIVLIAGDHK